MSRRKTRQQARELASKTVRSNKELGPSLNKRLKEIPEITGMRGYASQGVILFHFFVTASILRSLSFSSIVLSWDAGVDFFFVLSGFLLSIPFLASRSYGRTRSGLKEYYLKRVFRILPVYYLSLVIVVIFLTHGVTFEQIIANIFFAQNFSPSTFNSINGVNWTLAIEEIFYATLPLFSYFFIGKRWIYSLPVFAAISILYRYNVFSMYHTQPGVLEFYMWQYPSFIFNYAIGTTLANWYLRRNGVLPPLARWRKISGSLKYRFPILETFPSYLPMLGSILLLIATQYWIGSTYGFINNVYPLPGLLFAPEYGALLYFTLTSPASSILRRIFTNRPTLFAGKISYSVYLWHLPILLTLYAMKLPLPVWIISTYAVVMLVATLTYLFVEKPFLKLRNKILYGSASASKKKDTIPSELRMKLPINFDIDSKGDLKQSKLSV